MAVLYDEPLLIPRNQVDESDSLSVLAKYVRELDWMELRYQLYTSRGTLDPHGLIFIYFDHLRVV